MSPRLVAMDHRRVQRVGSPVHIDPHMGRLSRKVKALREATYLRLIPDIIRLSALNAQEPGRMPWKLQMTSMNRPSLVWVPLVSYPGLRRRNRSLYTCAQDVQVTSIVTI
jgi:hypothetical protein